MTVLVLTHDAQLQIIEGATLRVGTPLAVVKVDPETKKKTIIKLGKV